MAWGFVYNGVLRDRFSGTVGDGVSDVNEYHERKLRGRMEFRISFEVWENDHHRSYMVDNSTSLVGCLRDILENKLNTVMHSEDLVVSLTEVEYLGKPGELYAVVSVPKAKDVSAPELEVQLDRYRDA
jgi:hypothetical protein